MSTTVVVVSGALGRKESPGVRIHQDDPAGMERARWAGMGVKRVEDLHCWQLSMALHARVVEVCKRRGPLIDQGFVAQLLDAAEGGPRNIAEGFGRYVKGEMRQFFRYALSSILETETQLRCGVRRGLLTPSELQDLLTLARRASMATRTFMLRSPGPPQPPPAQPLSRRRR